MVLRMLYYDEAANTWLSTLTDLLEDIGLMNPFDIDPGNGQSCLLGSLSQGSFHVLWHDMVRMIP
jgi:hypothetical protein